jgi:hypothetical protein
MADRGQLRYIHNSCNEILDRCEDAPAGFGLLSRTAVWDSPLVPQQETFLTRKSSSFANIPLFLTVRFLPPQYGSGWGPDLLLWPNGSIASSAEMYAGLPDSRLGRTALAGLSGTLAPAYNMLLLELEQGKASAVCMYSRPLDYDI